MQTKVNICAVQLDDCLLLLEYHHNLDNLQNFNKSQHFEIELFRFSPPHDKNNSLGVQFILNGQHARQQLKNL